MKQFFLKNLNIPSHETCYINQTTCIQQSSILLLKRILCLDIYLLFFSFYIEETKENMDFFLFVYVY
jgi:hypothetical protein